MGNSDGHLWDTEDYLMHVRLLHFAAVRFLHIAVYIGSSLALRDWISGHAAVVGGYMFVWRLACCCDAGHGPHCRLSTCAVVGICNAIIVSPRLIPVVLCICCVACLPENYLWWPPKGAILFSSWNQLEKCVDDNLQELAEWYRRSD